MALSMTSGSQPCPFDPSPPLPSRCAPGPFRVQVGMRRWHVQTRHSDMFMKTASCSARKLSLLLLTLMSHALSRMEQKHKPEVLCL